MLASLGYVFVFDAEKGYNFIYKENCILVSIWLPWQETIKTYFCPMNDAVFMQRCFQLAQNGLGNVAPNPLVGAVLVHEGRIIAEGYHAQYGEAHAEVMAIRTCKHPELLPHSTLYVNLEPCSHFGKTPPCADLILEKKIPRVVICNQDPFPEVSGRGIQKLRDAGVDVRTGILAEEGEKLNRRFFTFHRKKRPYIILKWAQSMDGFLDGNKEKPIKITSLATDQLVHQWRTQEPGIMVGYNTARKDNPKLTARLFPGKTPIRIVYDPKLALPHSLQLFSDGNPSIIFNSLKDEKTGSLQFIKTEENKLDELVQHLYSLKIQSILIEGGRKTLQQFIDNNLWDEARVIAGNVSIGNGVKAPVLRNVLLRTNQQMASDRIYYFDNDTTHQP